MDSFIPGDAFIFSTVIFQDTSVSYAEQSDELNVDMLSALYKCLIVGLINVPHSVI